MEIPSTNTQIPNKFKVPKLKTRDGASRGREWTGDSRLFSLGFGAWDLGFDSPHEPYLNLEPERIVKAAGGPLAVIDCFGILDDDKIRRYFELGCEVKALGRGHIQRIKEEVRNKS